MAKSGKESEQAAKPVHSPTAAHLELRVRGLEVRLQAHVVLLLVLDVALQRGALVGLAIRSCLQPVETGVERERF